MHSLSFGRVDGRTVVMDVEADSYFLAEEATDMAPTPQCLPVKSLIGMPGPGVLTRPQDLFAVGRLLHRARRSLESDPFARVLDRVEQLAPRQTWDCNASARTTAAAMRFLQARRLLPFAPNCLPDSLALMEFLARASAQATLVFGVKLDPFAAHCWVQSGDVLLNDHLERVERFTPVRTVPCSFVMP